MSSSGRDRLDNARLVLLADPAEEFHRLVTGHDFPVHGLVGLRQLGHARLDGRQVLRRECTLEGKVVVEAVLDHRPDGHLGAGEQLLDGLRQQVGRRVADDLQPVLVPAGDDRHLGVALDPVRGVHQAAAHAAGDRGLGQAGADIGGELGDRHGSVEAALTAVRKRDDWHGV
jgi:hypothetical protein